MKRPFPPTSPATDPAAVVIPPELQQYALGIIQSAEDSIAERSGRLASKLGPLICLKPNRDYSMLVTDRTPRPVIFRIRYKKWSYHCGCTSVHSPCVHAVAVAVALRNAGRPDASPSASPNSSKQPPQAPSAGEPAAPAGSLAARARAGVGRPLTAAEQTRIAEIERLARQRRNRFSAWEVQHVVRLSSWDDLELPGISTSPYEFWLELAWAASRKGASIPEFLRPITDLKQMESLAQRWQRQKVVQQWSQRLAHLPAVTTPCRFHKLDLRLQIQGDRFQCACGEEGKPHDFIQLTPQMLQELNAAYHHGLLEIVPEVRPLWQMIVSDPQHGMGLYPSYQPVSLTLAQLGNLLRASLPVSRLLNAEGKPFVQAADPLRWQLTPAQSGEDDYEFRLALPDGTTPPDLQLLPGTPVLYLGRKAVYAGPPALAGTLHPHQPNRIPAAAIESPQGLTLLRALEIAFPPRIQERHRLVSLQVHVQARLHPPYLGVTSEQVSLRVEAWADEDPATRLAYHDMGWVEEIAAQPRTDGRIYEHDRSFLHKFPILLEELEVKWQEGTQTWRLRLSTHFPGRFREWMDALPPWVVVHLEGELASLLVDPIRAQVHLDCAEAGMDWFDLRVALKVSDTELTPEELKALLDAKGSFVRLGSKGWRRLEYDVSDEDDEHLARLGLSPREFSSEPQRLHALQLADPAATRLLPEAQVAHIQRRAAELKTRVSPPVPAAIQGHLRPYQVDGFHFLAYLTANRFGGILADDMGLGKTLQTLAWLVWRRAQPDVHPGPALVVCPKSVMDNWENEARRFAPDLRVRRGLLGDEKVTDAALQDTDLWVLNYAQLRGLSDILNRRNWLAVILDEGQCIKNPNSQTAVAARALRADHRLILTGTPIENRLLDLWSLMAFAMPGVLGHRAYFARAFDHGNDPLARKRLASRVRPFLLRRTKAEVATDLPDRVEEDLICEMEGPQQVQYQAELKHARQMLLEIKTRKDLDRARFNFLTSLLRLRQICCHPGLYNEKALNASSAKLDALLDLLEPLVEEGHKVLVFSQFTSMLDILRRTLDAKGWKTFYLGGDTENRGPLVADFQAAPGAAVFLISLKAGGFGLNLTAASYVVLFDPWWNPAVENQAIDRTHRIGQTNKVMAYRLIAKDSIEEKIRTLQRHKSAVAQAVLGDDSFARSLTLEDLRFLFGADAPPTEKNP